MDSINSWVMTLCACACVVSLAEALMPEGAVKKTAYFVLSLITASCLVSPLAGIKDISFDIDVDDTAAPYTDWLTQTTEQEFSRNVAKLINETLIRHDIHSEKISVHTSIDDDGSVYIDKARIIVDERYRERLDEIERVVADELNITADVRVRF